MLFDHDERSGAPGSAGASVRAVVIGIVVVVAVAAAVCLLLILLHRPMHMAIDGTLAWAADRGPWTAVVLAAVWIPAAVLLVPGSLLTLGTGFLLGVGWGTVVVSIGATAGAAAAFLVGRVAVRDHVRARLAARPAFHAVDEAVAREGFLIVLLLRLSPLFPYNVQNYAFGATAVPFRTYLAATWIGMLPGTLLYVWLGAGARTLADAAHGNVEQGPWVHVAFVAGLVATAAATWVITRAARRALARRGAVPDG